MKQNVYDILQKVYGARGVAFPGNPIKGEGSGIGSPFTTLDTSVGSVIAGGFDKANVLLSDSDVFSDEGTPIKKFTDYSLGKYEFLPATLSGVDLPNAIVHIQGEKKITETDVTNLGAVVESIFIRPYDVQIIVTLIGDHGEWPSDQVNRIVALWHDKKDKDKDLTLHTLRCALTDKYLKESDNFIFTKITHLDAQGAENVEIIQLDGRGIPANQIRNITDFLENPY